MPSLGDAALLQIRPFETRHLWFFVSEVLPTGDIAMFNLTGWKPPCDETCIVRVGDHPYVAKKSIITYRRGLLLTPTKWQEIHDNGWHEAHEKASNLLIKRIQQGALQSEQTPQFLQTIVQQFLTT
jgi:hypothetical protein